MSKESDQLIEETLTAWRPRAPDGGLRGHPAWHDLDPADRVKAYQETVRLRQLEAALDPDGLSSTGHAVLRRILEPGADEG